MKVVGEVPSFLLGPAPGAATHEQRQIQAELALIEPSDPPESAEANNDEKARILTELILQAQQKQKSRRRPSDSRRRRVFDCYDRTLEVDEPTLVRGQLFDRIY
jgi:hypothetical protein